MPKSDPRRPAMLAALGMACIGACIGACAPAARADVLEIGAQGAVTIYSAPTVFTVDGATPIQATPAPRAVRAAPGEIAGVIAEASRRYAVPQSLVQAVAWRESGFSQTAVSGKGAIGVMQLMSGTARQLGVDPYDMRQNIHGGAAYLSAMLTRYNGDTGLALAAYNAGPGAVDRYGGAPPFKETQRYVADILSRVSQGNGSPSTLVPGR
jgi:soluble lytic murein transglycosylase-like protein